MDHLSSVDLDSPSKTPLFLGIAAVILAIVAVVLGWMGFTKANALELQLADIAAGGESIVELQEEVGSNSNQLKQLVTGFSGMRDEVNKALGGIQEDISTNKKNIRGVTIQAGTALKKVQELEAKGISVRAAPVKVAPVVVSSSSSKDLPPVDTVEALAPTESEPLESRAEKLQTYRIQSGDYLSKVAARFQVSLNELLEANPGIDPNRLAIGQQIVIPSSN